jgi:hypothetical protein
MKLTTRMTCPHSAPQRPPLNGRQQRACKSSVCSCRAFSASVMGVCRYDMSLPASRQQCADANAVMWATAAAAAVKAVSPRTLVSAGTFTNRAGAQFLSSMRVSLKSRDFPAVGHTGPDALLPLTGAPPTSFTRHFVDQPLTRASQATGDSPCASRHCRSSRH